MTVINPNPLGAGPEDELAPDPAGNIWDALATAPGVVVEAPDVRGLGLPHSDDFETSEETVEDVRASAATDRTSYVVHHVVEELDRAAAVVRMRVVRVAGNVQPSTLLDYNPNRRRALIRIVTATQSIFLVPGGPQGGGVGGNAAAALSGGNAWPMTTGDPTLEVKSAAAVWAIGSAGGTAADVAVWEELNSMSTADLGGLGPAVTG